MPQVGAGRAGALTGVVESKAASWTLTPADSGKVFHIAAVDLVATLPPTEKGLIYRFIVNTISAVTGFAIDPNAADQIAGLGVTPAVGKKFTNTAATDVVGDLIEVIGDGTDGWYVTLVRGIWAKEA